MSLKNTIDPIYFTKVQYRETSHRDDLENLILLNIPQRELSYQRYERKRQMPLMECEKTIRFKGHSWPSTEPVPFKKMRSGKTQFQPSMVEDDAYEETVSFSYGIKLTEEQMEQLLPLCNVLDFEPFRDRKMEWEDEGLTGYRDGVTVTFEGITDSHYPLLVLPMDYYYDEAHIWPSEKLYRHLVKLIRAEMDQKKKLRGYGPWYGALSLPI